MGREEDVGYSMSRRDGRWGGLLRVVGGSEGVGGEKKEVGGGGGGLVCCRRGGERGKGVGGGGVWLKSGMFEVSSCQYVCHLSPRTHSRFLQSISFILLFCKKQVPLLRGIDTRTVSPPLSLSKIFFSNPLRYINDIRHSKEVSK